jgi:Mg-chelatase subunit ChlD
MGRIAERPVRTCTRGSAALCGLLGLSVAAAGGLDPPAAPTYIQCLGITDTRFVVRWQDNANDETEYRIERRGDGEDDFTEVGTLEADDGEGDVEIFIDETVEADASYLYRVRAWREADDSYSAYTLECASPSWIETESFRVFYNTADCPDTEDGPNCVPAVNADGQNETAARIGANAEGALAEYLAFSFKLPAASEQEDPEDLQPFNLKACDGRGCWSGQGFGAHLNPDYAGDYDHTTNAGQHRSVATTLHELFHGVQRAYGSLRAEPDSAWVREGQARAVEDLVCVHTAADDCVNVDDEPVSIYFSEVNGYLGNPNRPLGELSYAACLFWTFLCERYGSNRTEPQLGLDFLEAFWDESDDDVERDGIQVIEATLANLGAAGGFEEAFEDFVIASCTKDLTGPGVPARYQYADDDQPPGAYDAVALTLDEPLGRDDQIGPSLTDVQRWGARYFQVEPAADVAFIRVSFHVDSPDPAFFALLAVKDDDLVFEERSVGRDYTRILENAGLDRVAMVVAGLGHDVNLRYSFNVMDPVLHILEPLRSRPAAVGDRLAPGKFVVQLEVLDTDGSPVAGIDASDFTFTVGAEPVLPQDVITSAHVQGQYWFVVRAPVQAANGEHDLTVSWSDLTDTETDAVDYAARDDADAVLVVDRSGSMGDPLSKIEGARAAAKLFVDSFRDGDGIGLAGFNCEVEDPVELTLRPWNDDNRDLALEAIDDLTDGGETSIGRGLAAGLDELIARGDEDHEWALILLSDGLNTCAEDIDDFRDAYTARANAGDRIPYLHTVAIGPDANRPDLEDLARYGRGSYHFASEPAGGGGGLEPATDDFHRQLAEIYRVVSERIAGQSQVLSARGTAASGVNEVHPFTVEAGAEELVLAVSWMTVLPQVIVRDPDGAATYTPFKQTARHRVYRVLRPLAGRWEVEVGVGSQAPASAYLAEAAVKGDLLLHLYLGLAPAARIVGTPMPILVSLTEEGPVAGARVVAGIEYPSGETAVLRLHDDGRHGDGGAADGVYGNTLRATREAGNYRVLARATGRTAALGDFARQARESFHMKADTNGDQDCLPDDYERRVGLDPGVAQGTGTDSDGDRLTDCAEFGLGTHPLDPDTDDDGEADGSEANGGRDPLEPGDGKVEPPRVRAYPGVGAVEVRFNVAAGAVAYEIQRAVGASGPFAILRPAHPAASPFSFIDAPLENGQLHRYRLVSIGRAGERSAPSNPCSAVPRQDPYPPHGLVRINDDAPSTDSRECLMTLIARDFWGPEDGGGAEPDPRAVESGVESMMVSNRSDFEGAAWLPYERDVPWTLAPNAARIATVFARFRDRAGNESLPVQASIRVVDTMGFRLDLSDLDLDVCGGAAGSGMGLRVLLDAAEPVAGLQLGLRWLRADGGGGGVGTPDPSTIPQLVEVVAGPGVPAGAVELLAARTGGADLGADEIVIGLALKGGATIGSGRAIPVLELKLGPPPGATAAEELQLCFADGLGTPPIQTVVSVVRGQATVSVFPARSCGRVTLSGATPCGGLRPFHRGDANDDGKTDISDATRIFSYLFIDGILPPCLEATDVNDDASVDISDGVSLLSYLFLGEKEPPVPGPDTRPCGVDRPGSPKDLGCEAYTGCGGS